MVQSACPAIIKIVDLMVKMQDGGCGNAHHHFEGGFEMKKILIEKKYIECCMECPKLSGGDFIPLFCSLADRDDISDYHTIPDWCPLEWEQSRSSPIHDIAPPVDLNYDGRPIK